MILAINASRARSGGAIAHLIGIIENIDVNNYGITELHVWSYPSLLEKIPVKPWLKKNIADYYNKSIVLQLLWECFILPIELKKANTSILFNVDAGSVCRYHPMVTLSQDLLAYEPGEVKRLGYGKERLRQFFLRIFQNDSFRKSDGVIFLTSYVAHIIQEVCGNLNRYICVPHGVGQSFRQVLKRNEWPIEKYMPIHCVYVSNTAMYKHQWHVVSAIAGLRTNGYKIELTLVGGGTGKAQQMLEKAIKENDPKSSYVKQLDFIPHKKLPQLLATAHIFIFASSCETFGISLLEAMAVGLPIACSNRSSLPETLQDGGVYFDPENPDSIASAIETIINDKSLRNTIAKKARQQSEKYTWARCSEETFDFITDTYKSVNNGRA